jgi:hypothetical protein
MKSRFYAKEVAAKATGRYRQEAVTLCFHERVPTCDTKYKSVRFPYLLTAIGSREAIVKRARQIIRDLNAGWRPKKKSEVFRDEHNRPNQGWNRKANAS